MPAAAGRLDTDGGRTGGRALRGPGLSRAPVRAASDANKQCKNQGECIYGCVYRGPAVAAGSDVVGHCRPTSRIEGCYSMVDKGQLAGNICMNMK